MCPVDIFCCFFTFLYITCFHISNQIEFCGLGKIKNDYNKNYYWTTVDPETGKRKEIVSYPGASLREMILNAFVHTDYFVRSNNKIEFFEDRCKITGPGNI